MLYIKHGDIINLGRHRLMCADATSCEDVTRLIGDEKVDLVLTDPPYGIKVQHSDGSIGGAGACSWQGSAPLNPIPRIHHTQKPECTGRISITISALWRKSLTHTKAQGCATMLISHISSRISLCKHKEVSENVNIFWICLL